MYRIYAPIITIKDFTFTTKYTYEHPQLVSNPQQDFILTKWSITSGINADMGRASIEIEDNQNKINISAGDILEIKLGESETSTWFTGICDEPEIIRPGYSQKKIKLTSVGYGITLASKFISTNYEDMKISDIVTEIIKDDFTYDIQDVNIKLPLFAHHDKSQASLIDELANSVNAVYGVDPDLTFWFRANNLSSTDKITNDITDLDSMQMRNKSYGYQDSLIRNGHTTLIAKGTKLVEDIQKATSGDDNKQAFTNTGRNIFYIAYELPKLRFPFLEVRMNILLESMKPFTWEIRQQNNGSFLPKTSKKIRDGTFTKDDISKIVQEQNNVGYKLAWIRLPTRLPVPPNGKTNYLTVQNDIVPDFRGVMRGWGIHNDTDNRNTTVFPNYKSDDDARIVDAKFSIITRAKLDNNVRIIAHNTDLEKRQNEKQVVQNLRGIEMTTTGIQLITGFLDLASRVRRTYSGLTVSVPQNRLTLGKTVQIEDQFLNLKRQALLIGYDISADTSTYLTAIDMKVDLEEWI